MAGFLDGKSRIIDIVLTKEGRRKISQGTFRPSFVSFSDSGIDYAKDSSFGLEASSCPSDIVTVEAAANGYLLATGGDLNASGGVQVLPTGEEVDAATAFQALQTSQGSILRNLSVLQTKDAADGTFSVSPPSLSFVLSSEATAAGNKNIDSFPGIFEDKRFRSSKNFLYLPPVNKVNQSADVSPLGSYPDSIEDLGSKSIPEIVSQARKDAKSKLVTFGYSDSLQARQQTNLLVQVYELENGKSIRKMDVFDLGWLDIDASRKKVYVAGYEEMDSKNVSTFLGVFYFLVS